MFKKVILVTLFSLFAVAPVSAQKLGFYSMVEAGHHPLISIGGMGEFKGLLFSLDIGDTDYFTGHLLGNKVDTVDVTISNDTTYTYNYNGAYLAGVGLNVKGFAVSYHIGFDKDMTGKSKTETDFPTHGLSVWWKSFGIRYLRPKSDKNNDFDNDLFQFGIRFALSNF